MMPVVSSLQMMFTIKKKKGLKKFKIDA